MRENKRGSSSNNSLITLYIKAMKVNLTGNKSIITFIRISSHLELENGRIEAHDDLHQFSFGGIYDGPHQF